MVRDVALITGAADGSLLAGAAGTFLAPISGLSENGFKTVLDIDAVSGLHQDLSSLSRSRFCCDSLGHTTRSKLPFRTCESPEDRISWSALRCTTKVIYAYKPNVDIV